jgi:hypothetical protein
MLTRLADASLETDAAEAALADGAFHQATERLDAADAVLDELRAAWPEMAGPVRAVVGPSAAELRRRIARGRQQLPRLSALSVGTAVSDPEEEQEPRY